LSVFFQILAAALVIFIVWQIVLYLKWRIAVVSFLRYEATDFPRSTPREQAKSLKFIWDWTGRAAARISREQRTKMLTEQEPIDHDAARILFAVMATKDALDNGKITEAEVADQCKTELKIASLKSKLFP
jgi:hypothetical protein